MRWMITLGLLAAVIGFAGFGVALPTTSETSSSTDYIYVSVERRYSVWDNGWRVVLEGCCISGPASTERADRVLRSVRGHGLSDQESLALQCNQTLVFGEANMRMWTGTLIGVLGLIVAAFGWLYRRLERAAATSRQEAVSRATA